MIKSNDFINKIKANSILGISSFAGIISALPTSYLMYQAYRPTLGRYTMPLALFTQLTWSVVQTWSIYYLSRNLWQTLESNDPKNKIHQRIKIANKFKTAEKNLMNLPDIAFDSFINKNNQVNLDNFLQLVNEYAESASSTQPTSSQRDDTVRNILSYVGIAIGVTSSCFFYPMGKQAGFAIAKNLNVKQANLVALMVGGSSFLASSFCFAYTTKDCLEESYDRNLHSRLPNINNDDNDVVIDPYIVFLLSLSASAHRVTMTAKYINPTTLLGSVIITTSATSLVCTNYWSINNFSQKLRKKPVEQTYTANKMRFFKLTKALEKAVVNDMSDEHFNALNSKIEEMDNTTFNSKP